ncbi:hypothetical protein GALMADRAFT_139620 [Galerina marginata CBS 339.88]|uniref:Uncharacterized protein n=1 Tax=Galerina marginata (strain CBS 339.88) TaxID=685588 RepID=A0A067T9Z1_GALM3|nr:hypothetical protein GALMADRAFT_139620 [Galerina marginata CBS 339.88]
MRTSSGIVGPGSSISAPQSPEVTFDNLIATNKDNRQPTQSCVTSEIRYKHEGISTVDHKAQDSPAHSATASSTNKSSGARERKSKEEIMKRTFSSRLSGESDKSTAEEMRVTGESG